MDCVKVAAMLVDANRDYREILREEYELRARKNPLYSLRAFARDLGVAPSRIVEVLNYKRGLSRVAASRMAKNLGLNELETETFLNLVDSVHGRSKQVRGRAATALKLFHCSEANTLQYDAFELISDWYNYAVLELIGLANFKNNRSWIARRLDIPEAVVDSVLDRLKRVGLLVEERGKLRAVEAMTFSTNGIPSEGLKTHHTQILDKAKAAVYLQSVEQRDLSSMTMAIRRADIPRARELIKNFRRELASELESAPGKDAVYTLAIQFFQLDNGNEGYGK
jgi:uncharacterized protein (TIGR02147 family)